MRQKKIKQIGSILLATTLGVGLVGCTKITQEQTQDVTDTARNEQTTEESSGMGRYIEKVAELPEETAFYGGYSIAKQTDGTLLLFANNGECFESKDNGTTWNRSNAIDFTDLVAGNYILESAVASDGTVAIAYTPNVDESGEADFEVDEEETDDVVPLFNLLIYQNGEKHEFTMNFSEEEMYVSSFCFDETGRLFASVYGGNIYEINTQTGESTLFLSADDTIMDIQVHDHIMMCIMFDQLVFYDMEQKTVMKDEVLQNFVSDYCSLDYTGAGYTGYGFMGKDNTVYVTCEKGLYRHVLGGSAMEQVVDGNLSTFGNPSYQITAAMELDDKEFLVAFTEGRIVHYVYDEDIPTTPSEKISVYSLRKSTSVKQAILAYQTANPDMYVEYEIGLDENGVTREDALKKLNTTLMDGSGPDIILLDDLPYESYVEKGVLLDIKDIVEELNQTEGLYTNLIEPFYENGSLYAVPTEFKLPVLGGDKEMIAKVKDYEGIAEAMEMLRSKNPTGKLVFPCSAQGIMKLFSYVCEPAWKNEDGTINEEAVRNYLIQSKRIYDAQIKGLTQEDIDNYEQLNIQSIEWNGVMYEDSDYFALPNTVEYISGKSRIICGEAEDTYTMMSLFSLAKTKGFESAGFDIMNGQSTNVFHPVNILGINASSANQDKAIAFLQTMLSAEQQKQVYQGFPMNKTALEQMLVDDPDQIDSDGVYSYWSSTGDNSVTIEGKTYWFTEEEKDLLRNWIAQATTPFLKDTVLEDAVLNEGSKYICGEQDIDTTVQTIVQSTAIYMTE